MSVVHAREPLQELVRGDHRGAPDGDAGHPRPDAAKKAGGAVLGVQRARRAAEGVRLAARLPAQHLQPRLDDVQRRGQKPGGHARAHPGQNLHANHRRLRRYAPRRKTFFAFFAFAGRRVLPPHATRHGGPDGALVRPVRAPPQRAAGHESHHGRAEAAVQTTHALFS